MSKSRIFALSFVVLIAAPSFCFFMFAGEASSTNDRLIMFLIWNFLCFAYFMPMLLAAWTNNKNLLPIAILNTLTGFTGIGWVASLCWCFVNMRADNQLKVVDAEKSEKRSLELEAQFEHTKTEVAQLRQEVAEIIKRMPLNVDSETQGK